MSTQGGFQHYSLRLPSAFEPGHFSPSMSEVKVRIVLADDHPGVRAGIRYLLDRDPRIEVVGEADNGVSAIELVNTLEPDILLLDIEMPALNGVEVAKRLNQSETEVQILALSSYNEQEYILGMLNNGAAGYLIKDEAPELLIEAVLSISEGEEGWFSSRIADQIPERLRSRHQTRRRGKHH